ncbi:hypothetical protein [Bradyrhizobium sp. McL0616]|uniref:hypothetical protein n=1 Tax=Bradyrhizobium sp. McL0616 TaxID=3415674 RepID=UPI003CEFA188
MQQANSLHDVDPGRQKQQVGADLFLRRLPQGSLGVRALPTSTEYRESADHCRRLAAETHDQQERETLLKMATQWDHLADYKGRIEKPD